MTDPSLQGHEIPDLKMMKRQIRNFRKGETASVTLVFHASLPVKVRWYTSDSRNIAAHSEIPNMFPAEGMTINYYVGYILNGRFPNGRSNKLKLSKHQQELVVIL